MNLRARIINGRLLLCSEDGKLLPGQRDVLLVQHKGEAATITVTFVVDGERVKLEDC